MEVKMNINAAINEVILRIVKGQRVRVKQAFKNEDLHAIKTEFSAVKVTIEDEDDQYAYIKKMPDVSQGFTPENMARAVHDCNGKPISSEKGVVTGYGTRGQVMSDTTSTKCFARQVIFTDVNKNEYYIGTGRENRLFDPSQTIEYGRTGWIKCNKPQFDTYLTVLKTGQTFELRRLKSELNID
jgi:hypothetical protein